VDRGALAIRDFSMTAERFSDIVEELPESLRWQLLLWLYEFEESEMAKSVLASLERVAESSAKLTTTAEMLPEKMRSELSELIDDVDARQANMQKTLAQTRATTEALTELIEKTESTAQALDVTSKNVTETAAAWQATVEAISETFKKPETATDANTSRFSMADLNATANTVAVAAMEVRRLNEELMANANAWSTQTNQATTNVAWKLALLIGLTFVLALAYRLLVTRLVPGQRR
jgi:DNA mismatch repair ATPase MutS